MFSDINKSNAHLARPVEERKSKRGGPLSAAPAVVDAHAYSAQMTSRRRPANEDAVFEIRREREKREKNGNEGKTMGTRFLKMLLR